MATRDLSDALPALREAFLRVKERFESAFPRYELRPICVYRSPEEQFEAFQAGRSRLDGTTKKSFHNIKPARAIDAGIFKKNGSRVGASYIDDLLTAGKFDADLHRALYWIFGLLAQREGLRSGNDWDNDGVHVVPDPDESLADGGHIEVKA